MFAIPNSTYKYHVGGSLPPNAPSYVKRKADEDLYNWLKAGEYCYVLNSRQMGKSSLQVRTMQRLKKEEFACASIDITGIGSEVTPEQWYGGFINKLVLSFNLSKQINLPSWLRERQSLPPVQQLSAFIEEVILVHIDKKIVIFVDEIDSVLKLSFPSDDFFALIRFCYNQRADKPEYRRISFVLLGVATPSDLIQDKERAPFNIGRAIQLNGFQPDEVQPLAQGLEGKMGNPQAVIEQVLAWTGGQPFLTQKLCDLILKAAEPIPTGNEAEWVNKLVRDNVLKDWESQDDPVHLGTIRDRIFSNERLLGRLLGLYQKILLSENKQGKEVIADYSPEQWKLRLSGLVKKENGKLKVYNRIYKNVFGNRWVNKTLEGVNKTLEDCQPYAKYMIGWSDSGCQDESCLLCGQVLERAVAWAKDKSLSDLGYKFLMSSLELENRHLQDDLDSARRANQESGLQEGLTSGRPDPKKLQDDLRAKIEENKKLRDALESAKQANKNLSDENVKLHSSRNFWRKTTVIISLLMFPAGMFIYSTVVTQSRNNFPFLSSPTNTVSPSTNSPQSNILSLPSQTNTSSPSPQEPESLLPSTIATPSQSNVPSSPDQNNTVFSRTTEPKRLRDPKQGDGCDCPYDITSDGRRCGKMSAYSKARDKEPTCYVGETKSRELWH